MALAGCSLASCRREVGGRWSFGCPSLWGKPVQSGAAYPGVKTFARSDCVCLRAREASRRGRRSCSHGRRARSLLLGQLRTGLMYLRAACCLFHRSGCWTFICAAAPKRCRAVPILNFAWAAVVGALLCAIKQGLRGSVKLRMGQGKLLELR